MSLQQELLDLAKILGVDLSENEDLQRLHDEEHAEYVGTGTRQVR